MMQTLMKKKSLNPFFLFIVLAFLTAGCFWSGSQSEIEKAEKALKQENYKKAVFHLDRVIKSQKDEPVALEAARKAARSSVFFLKNYQKALQYYRYILIYSDDTKERYRTQIQIAKIYFEYLTDYEQAISEYSRLLEIANDKNDRIRFRKKIARSYFFLKNFYQSKTEIENILKENPHKEQIYEVLFLRGNIEMAQKETDQAIKTFLHLLENFPELAKKDNIALHLAMTYEEKENFARAIEVLDEMLVEDESNDFIEEKIERLRLRQSYLPGAKGLKK